jgi:hypothetical protein
MTILLIALNLILLAVLLYVVRSVRTIGSKLSHLQTSQKLGMKDLNKQISSYRQMVKRVTQIQELPMGDKKSVSWDFVLSLTSHEPRFHALPKVLEGLKYQLLQPTKILLNIAHHEIEKLPSKVKELAASGFITVNPVDDSRSAKKLIPALKTERELPIIVIDDDLDFDTELFMHLMAQHHLYPKAVIASRVHQITTQINGDLNRFDQWNKQYVDSDGPAADLMPTSGAGTLYPAGSLHDDAADAALYQQLSDFTDDLWWYFQARRNGTLIRRISGFSDLNFIEATQEAGLWKNGNQDRNESNLLNLIQKYGNPLQL